MSTIPSRRLRDTAEQRRQRALKANAARWHGPNSDEARAYDDEISRIMAADWARQIVSEWPPLDAETRHECARIILGDFDSRERAS